MKTLRSAVIGLGVGEKHAESMLRHPNTKLVGLCDQNILKLKEVSTRFPGVLTTASANDFFLDGSIDLVSVASYDEFHAEQILQGLDAGKHLFVEKPLCLSYEEAGAIVNKLRDRPNLKIGSNLILRKYPLFLKLREWIVNKSFGDIYAIEVDYNYGRLHKLTEGWRSQTPNYSITLAGGVHMVDLLLWMLEDRPTKVFSHGNKICSKNSNFVGHDYISALLEWGDIRVKLGMNFGCVQPHHHHVKIYGTEATFLHDITGSYWCDSRDPDQPLERVNIPYPGCHKGDLLNDFVSSIVKNDRVSPDRQELFDVLSICLAVDSSLLQRQAIDIPYFQL